MEVTGHDCVASVRDLEKFTRTGSESKLSNILKQERTFSKLRNYIGTVMQHYTGYGKSFMLFLKATLGDTDYNNYLNVLRGDDVKILVMLDSLRMLLVSV